MRHRGMGCVQCQGVKLGGKSETKADRMENDSEAVRLS
jgi:hypothetical protein